MDVNEKGELAGTRKDLAVATGFGVVVSLGSAEVWIAKVERVTSSIGCEAVTLQSGGLCKPQRPGIEPGLHDEVLPAPPGQTLTQRPIGVHATGLGKRVLSMIGNQSESCIACSAANAIWI